MSLRFTNTNLGYFQPRSQIFFSVISFYNYFPNHGKTGALYQEISSNTKPLMRGEYDRISDLCF